MVATAIRADMTQDASNPKINYYGRWQIGKTAVSINSGAMVEFAYTGSSCVLVFDVRGFTYYPAIFVQVDNGPVARTALSAEVSTVTVTPLFNTLPKGKPPFPTVSSAYHLVRFWVATHSLYLTPAAGKQWTTLVGACRFNGIRLSGGELVSLNYGSNQIEFIGDSITQGLRLLYTGTDDDIGQQMPYANWTQIVADLLGMKPIVTGFGGQGISTTGTCGAPPVNTAFPFVYDGVVWNPSVKPKVVVIYHGTNDGITEPAFQTGYTLLLETVRKTYPSARIFAVCPHNTTRYAVAIMNAVTAAKDPGIIFLDYSAGVISANETCDGCHLNPGGAVRLGAKLAQDIAERR